MQQYKTALRIRMTTLWCTLQLSQLSPKINNENFDRCPFWATTIINDDNDRQMRSRDGNKNPEKS
jgi:hypothetical protein